jgi:hypothetical protein
LASVKTALPAHRRLLTLNARTLLVMLRQRCDNGTRTVAVSANLLYARPKGVHNDGDVLALERQRPLQCTYNRYKLLLTR